MRRPVAEQKPGVEPLVVRNSQGPSDGDQRRHQLFLGELDDGGAGVGGAVHNGELIIPYAMSDYASTFATIPLDTVLKAMVRG
jgi:hypothetical protein